MKVARHVAIAALLIACTGCCSGHRRCARAIDETLVFEPAPVTPRSALFDGDGLDPVALAIGRSDWPATPRDVFEGERGTYYELFYDLQTTPYGLFWGDHNFTWRQFRSDRVGAFRRY